MAYSFDNRVGTIQQMQPPSRHERKSRSLIRLIKCKKEPIFEEYESQNFIHKNFSKRKRQSESLHTSPERGIVFSKPGSRINLSAMNSDKIINFPMIKFTAVRHGELKPLEKREQRFQVHHKRGFTSGNPLPSTTECSTYEKKFKHPRICFSNRRPDKKLKAFCLTQKKSESSKISLIKMDNKNIALKKKLAEETLFRDSIRDKFAPIRHPKVKLIPIIKNFGNIPAQMNMFKKETLSEATTLAKYCNLKLS
ncbi:unnamed protein product [Moneuplotes crassus]|uniref:Uncharacterized protein n=1 Tax=Euplotes crassus TaxID=5936 RepID=A0AAD1XY65_EUPCR|nr:unnamed protein product [Moneuplotes crassus]